MSSHRLIRLNKPYQVLSQFTDKQEPPRRTLASIVSTRDVYPAGRLDFDSEGLLLLTDSGELQARIADPQHKLPKRYWVQVEGSPTAAQLQELSNGVELKDGRTRPAIVKTIAEPNNLWTRNPPVISHRAARSSWLNIELKEGKNRQVRRMCAHVGLPVLRLVRHAIGPWSLAELKPGEHCMEEIHLPQRRKKSRSKPNSRQNSAHRKD